MKDNLHRPDCLLLHGWTLTVCDKELRQIMRMWLTLMDGYDTMPMNYVWRSPRGVPYFSHSVLYVPDEAWDDATDNGDF